MPGDYIREHFFGVDPRLRGDGRRPDATSRSRELQARRPRSGEGLRGLQGGRRAPRRADGDPGQDDQGLRPGRGGRRPQHHPPAEEAQRGRTASSSAAGSTFRSPTRRSPRRQFYKPPDDSPEMQYLRERRKALGGFVPGRRSPTVKLKPPKWEDYAEFFAGSEGREVSTTMAFVRLLVRAAARQERRPLHRADRARRSPHVRHGGPVPPVRHLLARRPALRAGRFRHRALLPRGEGRADPRRRHHRGRLDVVVHRRRHGPFAATA